VSHILNVNFSIQQISHRNILYIQAEKSG